MVEELDPPAGAAADWTIPQAWDRYSAAEHAMWDTLFARQSAMLPDRVVPEFMTGLGIGPYGVLALIMVMYLVLGCLMDAMAMIILTVPIIFPVIVQLGFDPIWFGVIIVMTVELGLIHPPVGMNVFVINSIARDVPLGRIYRGTLPFIAIDVVRLVILCAFPALSLWLPSLVS